jgi:PAS domain S-box-containing protein
MEGGSKANRQLTAELAALRERIRELEALEAGREAMKAELIGARQRYQHLLAVSPAIIYTTHASGDFACTFVSENIRAIMGFAPEEMTTDPKCWPDCLHQDDAPRVFGELGPLIEQGGGTVEYRFRHRDGHYVWVQDSFRVIYDEAGHPLELVGAWADITGLKEAERNALAANVELQDTKQSLSRLLAASPAIIYTTHALGDFGCTFVSENIRTIMGFSPEEMITDPKCWPDRLHPDDAPRVFSELGPLIEQGGGTVEYRFRHRDGHYVWVQDSFRVLYDDAGHPLELVGAWADMTKRKEAETSALAANVKLQETKQSLSRLIESSPDAIISTDKDGNVVLFNDGAETLLGYRAEEVVGRRVTLLYGGEAGANEVLREMRKRGGTISGFESVLRAKDDSSIPVLISASVLVDEEGKEVGTVGFATDLRERKREQDALQKAYDDLEKRVEERTTELKEARARLQYLLTVTPGIMYTNQATGNYKCTFVSRNVDPLMGFSEWEMLEDPEFWVKRLHPDDAPRVFEKMGPLVEQGGGTIEYRFRHRDGHYVWIQDTFRVVRDDTGAASEIVGSWADITHRKQVEHALGERMSLMDDLQNLVAASPAVIYTTKASGDFACTFVSENLLSTMGYAPWEMREDPKFWSKRLHPEDAPRVYKELASMIERGEGRAEYRFRHRRGHYLWIQDTFKVIRDNEGKPSELVGSWADISDRKKIESELQRVAGDVERRNRFIRETFGRYLADEVVDTLLETPRSLHIGGEKRKVTMMMADLRGFTSLSERLAPKWVVSILNRYLSTMVKVIKQYDGTIDEFIGDAIFVLFGAPVWRDDDAQRAVACAVAMQLAMSSVNEQNQEEDLPDLEMGIGIHTGQVVVGNIGSLERMKYGVVGSHVNLTSRIQSCTTGGQILVSEAIRREVGPMLKIGKQMELRAKGFEQPVTVSEVVGIGGPHKLSLVQTREPLVALTEEIPVSYFMAEGSQLDGEMLKGSLTKLSSKRAEVRLESPVPIFSNLEMLVTGSDGKRIDGSLHCKVASAVADSNKRFLVYFTSMSPPVETFIRNVMEKPVESKAGDRSPMRPAGVVAERLRSK